MGEWQNICSFLFNNISLLAVPPDFAREIKSLSVTVCALLGYKIWEVPLGYPVVYYFHESTK